MALCLLCHAGCDPVPDAELIEHFRRFHPEVYADGFETWPDGQLVVVDKTLEPEDFA